MMFSRKESKRRLNVVLATWEGRMFRDIIVKGTGSV
jgi:hypothetical protein